MITTLFPFFAQKVNSKCWLSLYCLYCFIISFLYKIFENILIKFWSYKCKGIIQKLVHPLLSISKVLWLISFILHKIILPPYKIACRKNKLFGCFGVKSYCKCKITLYAIHTLKTHSFFS